MFCYEKYEEMASNVGERVQPSRPSVNGQVIIQV